jgi:tetratricopeptide (TPR) repeat protein
METGTGYTAAERAAAYNNFGHLLSRKGEHAAAATYYRKALQVTERNMGRDHPRARRARDNLFETLLRRGRYDDALSVARTNLDVLRARYPDTHPAVPTAYQRVGHLLDNVGRSAEAEPLLRRAARLQARVRGPDHIRTHDANVQHALCLVERGQLARAERLLRAGAAAMRRVAPDSTTVDLGDMKTTVLVGEGRLHAERREWTEARAALERAYRRQRREAGLRAPLTQRALRSLVAVLEQTGASTEGARYRDSLMVR